jgi:hypothetical protein
MRSVNHPLQYPNTALPVFGRRSAGRGRGVCGSTAGTNPESRPFGVGVQSVREQKVAVRYGRVQASARSQEQS